MCGVACNASESATTAAAAGNDTATTNTLSSKATSISTTRTAAVALLLIQSQPWQLRIRASQRRPLTCVDNVDNYDQPIIKWNQVYCNINNTTYREFVCGAVGSHCVAPEDRPQLYASALVQTGDLLKGTDRRIDLTYIFLMLWTWNALWTGPLDTWLRTDL